ncbi:MAG: hypothetical protein MJB14_02450 [Spirochaetes bacterium]|nr:hypothetical protein [Spirochaetota bacterium]
MIRTIEFYSRGDAIFVEYNTKKYTLKDFLNLPEAKDIIHSMYLKIITDYPDEIYKGESSFDVVGIFIKKHFLYNSYQFDVVIQDDGKLVKFNLEK